MFSSIKVEEYMEPDLSDIFWVNMIAKNKVLGSTGTHFMHMRVKLVYFSKCFDEKLMSRTQKKIRNFLLPCFDSVFTQLYQQTRSKVLY